LLTTNTVEALGSIGEDIALAIQTCVSTAFKLLAEADDRPESRVLLLSGFWRRVYAKSSPLTAPSLKGSN